MATPLKETRNLALIVMQRRQQQAPLLDFEDTKTKEARLVAALVADSEPTETQLIRTLYGPQTPKNEMAFRKLHTRVSGKLLNHLYFLDHSDSRHLASRRYIAKCMELMHKSTLLYREGELQIAARLAKQCLALSTADGFTCYALEAAQLLRLYYAETQQTKPFHEIVKQLEQMQALRRLEEEAETLHAEFVFITNRPISANGPSPILPTYLEQIRQLDLRAQSATTALFYYRAKMIFLEQNGDFLGLIEYCQECEQQVAAGAFNPHRFDMRFNLFMQMYSYLMTHQPEKGLALAERAEKYFHPTSVNWVYFQEKHLLLALHANEFAVARRVLELGQGNPTFYRQSAKAQQRWELFSAYLDFAQPGHKISPARGQVLNRLALVMPDYSSDKSGLNVAILISQVLHFLREGNHDAVALRVESLRKYRQRYLREPAHQRTRLFLRLLELIADEHFDPKGVDERARPLLNQLAATELPTTHFIEVEIIPYPALWSSILQTLHNFSPSLSLA